VDPLYNTRMRECDYCLKPQKEPVPKDPHDQGRGVYADGTSRFSDARLARRSCNYMGLSTFANHSGPWPNRAGQSRDDAALLIRFATIELRRHNRHRCVINTAKVEYGSGAIVLGPRRLNLRAERDSKVCEMRGARKIVGSGISQPCKVRDGQAFPADRFVTPRGGRGDSGRHSGSKTDRRGADSYVRRDG